MTTINNQVVLARRDNGEKIIVSMDELETKLPELLDDIHNSILEKARKVREEKTSVAKTMDEFKDVVDKNQGFVKAMWCGDEACEAKIKEETGATSRCMPFEQ